MTESNEILDQKILKNLWPYNQFKTLFPQTPQNYNRDTLRTSFTIRKVFTSHGIWGIPCLEAIQDIKDFINAPKKALRRPEHNVLEVIGGTGYLSYWLQAHSNLDVICTDLQVEDTNWNTCTSKQWIPVESMKASEAICKYPGRTILASWIPYGGCEDGDDVKMLENMMPNQQLILIGERQGGCCASDKFFKMLEKDFEFIKTGRWVSAIGINDYLGFFKKKTSLVFGTSGLL